MNKELIEQIKKIKGVKSISGLSEQLPNSENMVIVTFEPDNSYEKLVEKAYKKGNILEYKDKGSSEWRMYRGVGNFLWNDFDYRIADFDEVLRTIANINSSAANSLIRWLGVEDEGWEF